MKKRHIALLVLALVVSAGSGYFLSPKAPAPLAAPFAASNLSDVPALGRRGGHKVGTTNLALVNKDQPTLLGINPVTGSIPRTDRRLEIILWYPASLEGAQEEKTSYSFATPEVPDIPADSLPVTLNVDGRAARDAAQDRSGGAYPLVIFSHGFRNFAAGYTALAEHLASRGYVVAAIDHRDAETTPILPIALSFGNTVATRAVDQRFVIAELTRRAGAEGDPLAGLYDPDRIGLMGYSMGGFGALITMGAGFDKAGKLFPLVPGGLLDGDVAGSPALRERVPTGVKALVAFAPWGGGEALRAWAPDGLAAVTVPSLFIVGDQDDVSGFDGGVRWIFDQMTGSDRRLLVYQGARHNIVGDATPPQLAHYFQFVERYEEPVWRRDRILSINAHAVTAFLDGQLKGRADSAAYLTVPTVKAADGVWPTEKPVGAALSGANDEASKGYWPGFQRRWALGLELHHKKAGE